MHSIDDILDMCLAKPGKKARLKDFDPDWEGDTDIPKEQRKQVAQKLLSEDLSSLESSQELLYAADTWSVLVIFQAMDAAGKDSTIKHVMSGINPQGCQVFSFKQPSAEELDHNFLWRCMRALPERGRIGIFNRSYYEEVLVVRVHSDLLRHQRIPEAEPNGSFWDARYDDINNFERHLTRNGTKIVKFFLNVSKGEQKKRFLDRINDSRKHWKFSASDVVEREHWDAYMEAYEECLTRTSTKWAPWYVVPANHKWVTRAIVAKILSRTIDSLGLQYPEVTPDQLRKLADAKEQLSRE